MCAIVCEDSKHHLLYLRGQYILSPHTHQSQDTNDRKRVLLSHANTQSLNSNIVNSFCNIKINVDQFLRGKHAL